MEKTFNVWERHFDHDCIIGLESEKCEGRLRAKRNKPGVNRRVQTDVYRKARKRGRRNEGGEHPHVLPRKGIQRRALPLLLRHCRRDCRASHDQDELIYRVDDRDR